MRVRLERSVTTSNNGHYQLEGRYGDENVVVVLDPSVVQKLPPDKYAGILALHEKIEAAATTKCQSEEVGRVHRDYSTEFLYVLIALTDVDLEN